MCSYQSRDHNLDGHPAGRRRFSYIHRQTEREVGSRADEPPTAPPRRQGARTFGAAPVLLLGIIDRGQLKRDVVCQ